MITEVHFALEANESYKSNFNLIINYAKTDLQYTEVMVEEDGYETSVRLDGGTFTLFCRDTGSKALGRQYGLRLIEKLFINAHVGTNSVSVRQNNDVND